MKTPGNVIIKSPFEVPTPQHSANVNQIARELGLEVSRKARVGGKLEVDVAVFRAEALGKNWDTHQSPFSS